MVSSSFEVLEEKKLEDYEKELPNEVKDDKSTNT